jgi:hypothetical protein
VSTEAGPALSGCECTHEPPHRFVISARSRVQGGILLTLQRLDERYPARDLFITNREMKMAGDFVYKGCFVCVDRGIRETAIALPKSDIDLGLPPP